MAELFPTVDEAGRFLSAKVRGFLAGQFPSRTEVLDLVTAEPVEVTDARVEQVLTDPSSAAAASLSATIEANVTASNAGKVGKGELVLSVRDFGAKGDGASDDTNAIKAALTALATFKGGRLVFPSGTYRITASLGAYNLSDTTLDLGNATIDASAIGAGLIDVLKVGGSIETSNRNLTADAVEDSKTLNVSTTGISAGDMVFIGSNTVFDPNRTGARYGEVNFVETINSATRLTLKKEMAATYTVTDVAFLRKIIPLQNFTLRGGAIQSTNTANTLRGVAIEYGRNVRIYDVSFRGINRVHLQLLNSAECIVSGCRFSVAGHATQAYGVSSYDATQDLIVSNCQFSEVRHSFTTTNDISGVAGGIKHGLSRRVLVTGCVISDSAPNTGTGTGGDALDTHAGAEDIYFVNNVIHSSSAAGINFEARSGVIRGNIVRNVATNGIYVNLRGSRDGTISITGNTVSGVPGYGIAAMAFDGAFTRCIVANNTVEKTGSTPIRVTYAGSTVRPNQGVVVAGNSVTAPNTMYGVEVRDAPGAVINGNVVQCSAVGVLYTGTGASITGNTVDLVGTTGANAWGVRLHEGASCVVAGNNLRYTATGITTTHAVSLASGGINNSGIFANVTQGFATKVSLGGSVGTVEANNI